jgi:ABC-2 type transport system permease protein
MTIVMTTPTSAVVLATPAKHRPITRSTRDDVGSVPTVLKSEWIKLSSLRSNHVVVGLIIGIGLFVSWAVATFVTDEILTVSKVFIYSTVLTAVFAAIAGTLLFSAEAQHGMLAIALTAQPARWVIVAAKTIVASAFGLVLGLAGLAAGFTGAVLGGLEMGDTSGMAATTLWALVLTSLSAVFGLGVGMIARHSSAAISGLLVWSLVIENLLRGFAPAKIVRYLPFNAGNGLLDIEATTDTPEKLAVAFSRVQDGLLFSGYTIAALIVGTVLLYRRDTN